MFISFNKNHIGRKSFNFHFMVMFNRLSTAAEVSSCSSQGIIEELLEENGYYEATTSRWLRICTEISKITLFLRCHKTCYQKELLAQFCIIYLTVHPCMFLWISVSLLSGEKMWHSKFWILISMCCWFINSGWL